MDKNDFKKLRNKIGSLPVEEGGYATDDNLAIALCTYFESLPECPEDDVDVELGWSKWAMEMTDNLLGRIISSFTAT